MQERVTIRVAEEDRASWERAAVAEARKLADWCRLHLNRAAAAQGAEAAAAPEQK